MPGSKRNQKKSNKNKNNKILKRMKELSNYYRKKLFRGGALTPEQATTLADLESKKLTTTLSPEEQTDYDSLVAMRDAVEPPVVESATSDAASSDASSGASNTMGAPGVEAGQDMAPTETDANPAEGASLFDTVSSAVGSAVNTVKGAVGMEGGNQRRKSNKRNNKRRNSKRQSRRQRR